MHDDELDLDMIDELLGQEQMLKNSIQNQQLEAFTIQKHMERSTKRDLVSSHQIHNNQDDIDLDYIDSLLELDRKIKNQDTKVPSAPKQDTKNFGNYYNREQEIEPKLLSYVSDNPPSFNNYQQANQKTLIQAQVSVDPPSLNTTPTKLKVYRFQEMIQTYEPKSKKFFNNQKQWQYKNYSDYQWRNKSYKKKNYNSYDSDDSSDSSSNDYDSGDSDNYYSIKSYKNKNYNNKSKKNYNNYQKQYHQQVQIIQTVQEVEEKPCTVFVALLKEDRFYVGYNPKEEAVEDILDIGSDFLPTWCKMFPLERVIFDESPHGDYKTDCKNLALALMKKVGFFRVRGGLIWKNPKENVPYELNSYQNYKYEQLIDQILQEERLNYLKLNPENCTCGPHKIYACPSKNSSEAEVIRCYYCSEIGHFASNCMLKKFNANIIDEFNKRFNWLQFDPNKDLSNYEDLLSLEGAVYVLELHNNCYYVGHTQKPVDVRFREHMNQTDTSSLWCLENRPKRVAYSTEGDLIEEDYITLILMRKFGWWKVRGGRWCSPDTEVPEHLSNPFALEQIDPMEILPNVPTNPTLEEMCKCKVLWEHKKFACPLAPFNKEPRRWDGIDKCLFCGKVGHRTSKCYQKQKYVKDLREIYLMAKKSTNFELTLKYLMEVSPVFVGDTPSEIQDSINYLEKFYGYLRDRNYNKSGKFFYGQSFIKRRNTSNFLYWICLYVYKSIF